MRRGACALINHCVSGALEKLTIRRRRRLACKRTGRHQRQPQVHRRVATSPVNTPHALAPLHASPPTPRAVCDLQGGGGECRRVMGGMEGCGWSGVVASRPHAVHHETCRSPLPEVYRGQLICLLESSRACRRRHPRVCRISHVVELQ